MYNRSIAKPVINMLMFNQGRSQDFRKGGTLKITINSNYKTPSAPANVTGKAIYNDFCHAVSGTVMLGTPKPRRRPSHYLAITLSLRAVYVAIAGLFTQRPLVFIKGGSISFFL